MLPDPPRALARRFFAEQDRLRGGPAEELCALGYTAHLAGNPPLDYAGHVSFAAAFYAAFPDLRHEVELVVVEGERAAVRFRLHGTHTGPFAGVAPTGRPVTVTAMVIMHIVDNQVLELWGEFDQLGLVAQLNGAPLAAEAPEHVGI